MAPAPLPSPATPTAADNRRGILAIMLSMALFVINDTLTKLASATMPPGEIMAVRGAFATILAFGLAARMGHAGGWRLLASRKVLVRGGLELAVAVAFLSVLGHMALGDLTAIMQSSPLIIALVCALTGLEPMGWRRWMAVLAGFAGVVLVARPGGPSLDVPALIAFLSASLVAARDLVTRTIRAEVPTALVLVATSAIVMLGGFAMRPLEDWAPLTWPLLAQLAAAGLFVAAGHFFSIAAFRGTEVAVVSPFRYSVILWAGLFGFLVFGERPDAIALIGAALIAASGLYTVHRERVRARVRRSASLTAKRSA